jgi:hypothetical protein
VIIHTIHFEACLKNVLTVTLNHVFFNITQRCTTAEFIYLNSDIYMCIYTHSCLDCICAHIHTYIHTEKVTRCFWLQSKHYVLDAFHDFLASCSSSLRQSQFLKLLLYTSNFEITTSHNFNIHANFTHSITFKFSYWKQNLWQFNMTQSYLISYTFSSTVYRPDE